MTLAVTPVVVEDLPALVPGFPFEWQVGLMFAARCYGVHVRKSGRGPGSLEDEATAGLDYHVLTADRIEVILPWLREVYWSPALLAVVQPLLPEPVAPVDAPWGLNVNMISGISRRYEVHVDEQPYTAILFASDLTGADGGELYVREGGGVGQAIPCRSGRMVVFDGSVMPHAVLPLAREVVRISVPMVFAPIVGTRRSADADAYLFGGQSRFGEQ